MSIDIYTLRIIESSVKPHARIVVRTQLLYLTDLYSKLIGVFWLHAAVTLPIPNTFSQVR